MPRNRIDLVKNNATRVEQAVIGTTGMLPGELCVLNSSGQLVRPAVAAAAQEVLVLLEDAKQGKTLNDAYTAGDTAQYLIPLRGDVMQLRLAAANTIAIGDPLDASGANGLIQKATVATTKQIVAWATEAKNTAGLTPCRIA